MSVITKYSQKLRKALLIIPLSLLLLLFIFIIELSLISFTHISQSREYYAASYEFAGNCYVDSDLIWSDCSSYYSFVDDSLSLFPSHIRPFIANNWAIVFTPEIPSFAIQYLSGIDIQKSAAVTVPHIKTVFILTDKTESIPFVLSHEFGHILAVEYGSIDCDPAFLKLYEKYKESFIEPSPYAAPGYAASSPYEFFASTMAIYVTESEWLEPEIKDYMEWVLEEVPYSNALEEIGVKTAAMLRKHNFRDTN